MTDTHDLDRYIPATVRQHLEERYYARINNRSRLECLAGDQEFLRDPASHIAMFADHGVVHARNVARQLLHVLETVHGTLIEARSPERLAWMCAYGVTLAFLHDVGMVDGSRHGRSIHPEFAARLVLKPEFDDQLEALWAADSRLLAARLADLSQRNLLVVEPIQVLRELLALAFCHSKSKVPGPLLDDLPGLRRLLQRVTQSELQALYERSTDDEQPVSSNAAAANGVAERLSEPVTAAFSWLDDKRPLLNDLALDAIDTVRALRSADALRQRGTMLKTSGSYEIFVDQTTAQAIYALRKGNDQLFLLSVADRIAAGEANLAGSELGRNGDLRVSFHRGTFATETATRWAAYCAAVVVNDVQSDVLGSFRAPDNHALHLVIESVDDNLAFADLVVEQLSVLNPTLGERMEVVPSLRLVSQLERTRYLQARTLDWERARREELLVRVARSGHNTAEIDVDAAFDHTRLIVLQSGEQLIQAGTPSGVVYIPFDAGLEVQPLGGYTPFTVQAWMPLGGTGVVRGAIRNADIVARGRVELLAIPHEIYLRHWHRPFDVAGLMQALGVKELGGS